MAEESSKKPKLPRRRKTPETVRERAEKQSGKSEKKPGRVRKVIHRPLSTLKRAGAKEYHPVRIPAKGRTGRVLNKRVKLVPNWLKNAWAELRQVTWPKPRDAARLTLAVFVFAAIFAVIVQLLDFGFNKLFREILLG